MSQIKRWILVFLVGLAFLSTSAGGLRDMFGISFFGTSKEHNWNDGIFLMLVAIFVAITLK